MKHAMRDFSWIYFTITGDVEAYMLYKEISSGYEPAEEWNEEELEEDLAN